MNIPINKVKPPINNPELHLFRKRLINKIDILCSKKKRTIYIEAQAGQGKSIFAVQYLNHINVNFSWYQIDPEDSDPILFITTLYHSIEKTLPGFSSRYIKEMIEKGELQINECEKYAKYLAEDLNLFLKNDFYIVFDDLYRIEEALLSLNFIERLIQEAGAKTHFIIISRYPAELITKKNNFNANLITISNRDLAISKDEIIELFNRVLKIAISTETLNRVYNKTEGWIMGVIFESQTLLDSENQISNNHRRNEFDKQNINIEMYFKEEIVLKFSGEELEKLMILSFLKEIPVDLARELTGDEYISDLLNGFISKNYFISRFNDKKSFYNLHHFFNECLNNIAINKFDSNRVKNIKMKASLWYLNRGEEEIALDYLLKAGAFKEAQILFKKVGLKLFAENRIVTLKHVLNDIPDRIIRRFEWLSFFYGLICFDSDVSEAHTYLEHSNNLFIENKDLVGELLSSTQLLNFHMIIDGKFNFAKKYIYRSMEIFDSISNELSTYYRFQAAYPIALGLSFIIGDRVLTRKYNQVLSVATKKLDSLNFEVLYRYSKAFDFIFFGDLYESIQEIEKAKHIINKPQVSEFSRTTIKIAEMNIYEMTGDFFHYKLYKNRKSELLENTCYKPFIFIWDIDIAIAEGEFDQAYKIVEEGLELKDNGGNGHYISQFLHYKAFLHSLSGDKDKAVKALEKSLILREESGGIHFSILSNMFAGATYTQLRDFENAEHFLNNALKESKEIDEQYVRAGVYAYYCILYQDFGHLKESIFYAEKTINLLKQKKYIHFFCWYPNLMERIFSLAVRNKIEVDFVRRLSADRLKIGFTEDGCALPLLQIRTSGKFSIGVKNKEILNCFDLTPIQQNIFSVLISSPDNQININKLLEYIWGGKRNARSSFDTAKSRLGQEISKYIEPYNLDNYMVLKNKIFKLKNCRSDIEEFLEFSNKGIRLYERKNYWMAENMFRLAFNLIERECFREFSPPDFVDEFIENTINTLLSKISEMWSQIIEKNNYNFDNDLYYLEMAASRQSYNTSLFKNLYNIHTKNKDTAKACRIIELYRTSLLKDNYAQEEISDFVNELFA